MSAPDETTPAPEAPAVLAKKAGGPIELDLSELALNVKGTALEMADLDTPTTLMFWAKWAVNAPIQSDPKNPEFDTLKAKYWEKLVRGEKRSGCKVSLKPGGWAWLYKRMIEVPCPSTVTFRYRELIDGEFTEAQLDDL